MGGLLLACDGADITHDSHGCLLQIHFTILSVYPVSYCSACIVPVSLFQSTFEVLVDICPKPKAMVVDVCKNVTRVFDYMGKLLAHPLFRVVQEKQDHRLHIDAD